MRFGPHGACVVAASGRCVPWGPEPRILQCLDGRGELQVQRFGDDAVCSDNGAECHRDRRRVVGLCNELNANVSYPGYGTVKFTEAGSIYEVRRW
eukprot:2615714-Prymnesium_polylepis.1